MQTIDMFQPETAESDIDDLFIVRTRQCVDCGSTFQTAGRGRHCTHCLVNRQPDMPLPEQAARRACCYCQQGYVVPLDYAGPPLCDGCRDVPATRQRILRDLTSILEQMDAAIAAFDVVARRSADIWERLEQALAMRADGRATEQQLAARWAARMQDPDQRWPELLRAYEDREVALAPLNAERRRLEDALECLEGL